MKRSDKLRQAREAVVEKLRTMETDAADRIFTDDERKAFDGLIADIKGIDEQIESAITAEEAIRGEHPSPGNRPIARLRRRGDPRLHQQGADVHSSGARPQPQLWAARARYGSKELA